MRALVTGAAGLIGAQLVCSLANRGYEVRALVRETSRRDSLTGAPVEIVVADVLNAGRDLDMACADCDVVFHGAAQFAYGVDAATLYATAVAGTENMLAACARMGVQRIVVTSSSVVFGHRGTAGCIDEAAGLASDDGEPAYVAAKIVQHRRALELGAMLKLDVRLACPTMTLGPTAASRLGPSNGLVVAYLNDPFGCTYRGGCNLVAARDVATGHVLIAEHGAPGEAYLLGSANLTWQQIHAAIAELAGVAPPRLELNQTLTFLAATAEELRAAIGGRAPLSTREQATMVGRYYWYSHAKAATLGYAPTSARAALIETVSWLAASPHISREVRAGMHLAADIYRFRATARGEPD